MADASAVMPPIFEDTLLDGMFLDDAQSVSPTPYHANMCALLQSLIHMQTANKSLNYVR